MPVVSATERYDALHSSGDSAPRHCSGKQLQQMSNKGKGREKILCVPFLPQTDIKIVQKCSSVLKVFMRFNKPIKRFKSFHSHLCIIVQILFSGILCNLCLVILAIISIKMHTRVEEMLFIIDSSRFWL